MKYVLYCLTLLFLNQSCISQDEKINGISFVASREQVVQKHIEPIKAIHANYAAVMPFGFIERLDHPEILYNTKRQWFGETLEGVKQYIDMLHKNNIHVMLKPQIWVWHGEYTGHLKMSTEEDWKTLEDSYRNFIVDFAQLAEEENVEMFCIGTELEQFTKSRPDFWNSLITEIRTVYKGKLTYAANWDEYKRISFWEELDYIGVDAYFPVSHSKTPSVEEVRKGWQPWKKELQQVSERENKKIIFTEYGYRSVDFSGKEPWKSDREMKTVNLEAQKHTLTGLFEEVWDENWFAGGFLWKWHMDYTKAGGSENNRFTPQNKPVETIIRQHYKINN